MKSPRTTGRVAEARTPLPIVCLPGIRGDRRVFSPLLDVAGAETPMVPLDLPPGAPALAAARLLPHLPAGPVHLLTGSYGGLVARFLPPQRIASLACIGTLPAPTFLDPQLVGKAQGLLALPDGMMARLYRIHGRRSLQREGVPEAVVAALCDHPLSARTLRGRLRGVLSGHHGVVPPVPCAWIHGSEDAQIRWTEAQLRAAVPGVTCLEVDGGHFPHATHPAILWRTLRDDWWAGLSALAQR